MRGGIDMKTKLARSVIVLCVLVVSLHVNDVNAVRKSVKLTQYKVILYAGKTKIIKLSGSKSSKVKWQSTKPKIAGVKSGKITGKTPGKCYVVAKYNGKSYRCEVRVMEKASKNKPAASPTPSSEPEGKSQLEDKIDFVISKYDPQTMTLSMTIKNHSGSMVNMGEEITIKKYENENLVEIPRKSNEFREIAMIVQDDSKVDFDQNLGTNYAPLTAGKYIAFKNVYGVGTVSAEFTVE